MTRHLATLRAFHGTPFGRAPDYILSPEGAVARPGTHCHLVVELHPYPGGLRAWLRIIHCTILCAFTIPEVITLVLHPVFRRAAVTEGFRNFPQFDSVAARGHLRGTRTTSGHLLCRFHDPLMVES